MEDAGFVEVDTPVLQVTHSTVLYCIVSYYSVLDHTVQFSSLLECVGTVLCVMYTPVGCAV